MGAMPFVDFGDMLIQRIIMTEPPNLYKFKYDCPPFNTLTHAYSHLYKRSSLPSVTKDLGKSTLHQDRMIK